ncbi:3-hydroxyisobutyrate dehydrogenase-like protein [Scheffersomyces xylosifermentans]|uniref:3-hydroxyisobutyrate dehydrogenase-like protein n=1 Tax=Scheffersomyces xylosifermentans TaxID=1304137 RepID=UPI00315CB7C4
MYRTRLAARSFSTFSPAKTNYAFVGLGQMGQHMARHIYNKLEPNDKLYVNDSVPAATEAFVKNVTELNPANKHQLRALPQLSDLVTKVDEQLDFIITMVPEGRHVRSVVTELLEHYQKSETNFSAHKTTFIDSSTIDIPTSREVHEFVKKEVPNFDFIDAPVSGGVAGARKASLSFMLSRPTKESMDADLVTLLNKMGANLFPCGEKHGAGLAAKLSNNYLLAVTNLAVADSFQLAKSFGLNLKDYAKLVSVSTGKCWAAVDNCPIPGTYPEDNLPADVGYKGGFVSKLTRKDLVLATASAEYANRFLYLGEVSKHWYDKACEREDLANRDLSVLFEWLGELEKDKDGNIVEVRAK